MQHKHSLEKNQPVPIQHLTMASSDDQTRTRCYWAILDTGMAFQYLDPLFQQHMQEVSREQSSRHSRHHHHHMSMHFQTSQVRERPEGNRTQESNRIGSRSQKRQAARERAIEVWESSRPHPLSTQACNHMLHGCTASSGPSPLLSASMHSLFRPSHASKRRSPVIGLPLGSATHGSHLKTRALPKGGSRATEHRADYLLQ